ncbi:MAG: hypothetical protein ACKVS5_06660 [Parvularculaceae bacterium]
MHRFVSIVTCVLSPAAFAQTAPLAPVEETVLSRDAFATGLLDRSAGALAPDLWRGASAQTLGALLNAAPLTPSSPSIGVALRRVLLSAGDAPASTGPGSGAALGGVKLRTLVRLGFIEEAREIEGLAVGGKSDAGTIEAMATADLLAGDAPGACAKTQRISAPSNTAFGVKLRALCYVVAGELDAAGLALGALRERGPFTETDDAFLGPLVAGAKPRAGLEAIDPVHYAVARFAGAPVALSPRAEAGVLKAVATDPAAAWPARLAAAKRAAAMGVMSAASLRTLFSAAPLGLSEVADAASAIRQRPDDPVALAAAWQLARSKTAPEFQRDRAALVALALGSVRDFDTLFAAAALFADDVRGFDGMLVGASEADAFALARLALGDVAGAETWLQAGAVGGVQSTANSPRTDVSALIAAVRSGGGASPPLSGEAAPAGALAAAVDAAIEAAAEGITGQAALAALAASVSAAAGDRVAEVVVSRGFTTAGLDDLRARRTIERALQARFPAAAPAAANGAAVKAATPPEPPAASGKPAPRVKPAPSQ